MPSTIVRAVGRTDSGFRSLRRLRHGRGLVVLRIRPKTRSQTWARLRCWALPHSSRMKPTCNSRPPIPARPASRDQSACPPIRRSGPGRSWFSPQFALQAERYQTLITRKSISRTFGLRVFPRAHPGFSPAVLGAFPGYAVRPDRDRLERERGMYDGPRALNREDRVRNGVNGLRERAIATGCNRGS